MTKAEGNIRGLYARVAHWREKNQKESAAHGLLSLTIPSSCQETPSSLSSSSESASAITNDSMKSRQRDSSARELFSLWMDPEKTVASMSKRHK